MDLNNILPSLPTSWQTLRLDGADGPVCTLWLSRPEHRNAMSHQLVQELVECLSLLRERRSLRVLILGGDGAAFCSGGDLKERLAEGASKTREQRATGLRAIELLDNFPCPVIAMINGSAIAGGLELALGCDIRIAADDAVFALPEVLRAGGFPGGGGPVRLTKMIGRGRTSLLVFSARQFSACEALEFGIVDQIVPADSLRKTTADLAADIAANSPAAVRAAKVLIRGSLDLNVAEALQLSRELREPFEDGPDFTEALQAWRARRPPVFKDA
ncbi:enoyl-CoA hydratase-related protein [Cupriavidus necator]|uniref:enoyl-CoA hydratase/isomerase family protein n=1 Tax=Cupriavidus necator TaxID=106590 RepID=UPI003ECCDDCB